jgi:hypothetical protein
MVVAVPPMMVGFAKHPLTRQVDTSSVEFVMPGAAPLTDEVQTMCEPLFPRAVTGQGYGLTETSPMITVSPRAPLPGGHRYGTSGVLVPATAAWVVAVAEDSSCEDVPEGAEGELWVQGPQVMKGYLTQADTDIVLLRCERGEWLRTGDLLRRGRAAHRDGPRQGAHQVEGVPDRARGDRGAAAAAPRGRRGDRRRRRVRLRHRRVATRPGGAPAGPSRRRGDPGRDPRIRGLAHATAEAARRHPRGPPFPENSSGKLLRRMEQ